MRWIGKSAIIVRANSLSTAESCSSLVRGRRRPHVLGEDRVSQRDDRAVEHRDRVFETETRPVVDQLRCRLQLETDAEQPTGHFVVRAHRDALSFGLHRHCTRPHGPRRPPSRDGGAESPRSWRAPCGHRSPVLRRTVQPVANGRHRAVSSSAERAAIDARRWIDCNSYMWAPGSRFRRSAGSRRGRSCSRGSRSRSYPHADVMGGVSSRSVDAGSWNRRPETGRDDIAAGERRCRLWRFGSDRHRGTDLVEGVLPARTRARDPPGARSTAAVLRPRSCRPARSTWSAGASATRRADVEKVRRAGRVHRRDAPRRLVRPCRSLRA